MSGGRAPGPWQRATAAQAPGVQTRMLAARVLGAVVVRHRSLKAELSTALPQLADGRDRALLEAICFAALRRRVAYVAALAQWMQRPLGPADADLTGLLLAGFAQLDALQLPAHAALSATVDAARALGRDRQAGMVNAVLRRAQREGMPAIDPAEAWPVWLREAIRTDWPGQADAIFAVSQCPAPMWLRVNRQQVSVADYLLQLQVAGITAVADPVLEDGLRLETPVAVTALPGFSEGRVSVQDGAAQHVADALPLAPGLRVLDACAAPGGKAAHLLEREPSLHLLALDVDPRRARRISDTFARTGIDASHAQVKAGDAARPADWWDGQPFDLILLDAPCSATGIVRRQPDVLLHRRAEDLQALLQVQRSLLDAAWSMLRPGGTLVYATCSVLQDENARQVEAFVQRHADVEVIPLDAAFGHASGPGRQRLPGEQDCDGFFYARLQRRG